MSEQMDRAVLTMPYELAMGDELSRMQFWSRVQLFYKEQAARIEADEAAFYDTGLDQWVVPSSEILANFAALVSARTREECARLVEAIEAKCVIDDVDSPELPDVASAIRAIRAMGERT